MDYDSTSNCEMCGAITEPMGVLGRRIHYRCAACGWMWSGINDNHEAEASTEEGEQ